jgi:hypothetical protein
MRGKLLTESSGPISTTHCLARPPLPHTNFYQPPHMARMPRTPVTPTKRKHICVLRNKGWTIREIADELGIPRSTVADNDKRSRELQSFYAAREGRGRPRQFTKFDEQKMMRAFTTGCARDATHCQQLLFPNFNPRTIRNYAIEHGLYGRVRCKVPAFTPSQIEACLNWSLERRDWGMVEWGRVIFSDESKFNLFGSDGRQYCRRR